MNMKNKARRMMAAMLILLMLGIWPISAASAPKEGGEAAAWQEVTLNKGSITQNIIATGSLTYEHTTALTLPLDLTLSHIDVKVGEAVSEGQVLAQYDEEALKNSLKKTEDALVAQNELITGLIVKQTSEQSIRTALGGVIKKLYLKAGQPVKDTLKDGPTALISANGLMEARVTPAQPLSLGQEVKVKIASQTQTGSVARLYLDGSALITFPDTKAEIDETVQVSFNEFVIGQGKAQVNLPYHLFTLVDGVVDSVPVEVNSAVRPGSTIYKIKHAAPSGDYADALKEREELYKELKLYQALTAKPVYPSPMDGIVASLDAAEKTLLLKDTQWLSLYHPDSFLMEVSVDELDILSIQSGQQGTASFDALPEDDFPVQVQSINLLGQSSGGITDYTVTLSLLGEAPDERLRFGMNGTLTLTVGEVTGSVLVPLGAVLSDRGGSYVFIKGDNKQNPEDPGVKTYIDLGLSDTDYAAVISGLNEGDVVLMRRTALPRTRTMQGPGFLNPDAPASPGGGRRP